ncbi:PLP-dependent aminotransferase family protein [Echinicola strongylocentroti]|uniref:PLP-dependent aminotransferase family protein n=1 Tax=Echinicola strongylocentroti TaxID=1795355 RepID=A0A2Z4IFH0_9BACT|nr:PLP-dependent aminotransferase family protein [Echinicola strongylocentroti]AWW29450.1 PLP-dependent aminotransferase family protein [Echinicola strongylocentroti]
MLRPWKLQIEPNFDCDKAVYLQIADAIIVDIREGKLKPGDALPGSRLLAGSLKVNRNTIVQALDVLLAEGWLTSKARKGTFVSDSLQETTKAKNSVRNNPIQDPVQKTKPTIVFDDGFPDSKLAPIEALSRAYRQIFNRTARWKMMGYANPLGDLRFREALVQMLNFNRGMHLSTEQLCVTRGSQMGMYLAAQVLLRPKDAVIVENPGYKPAWRAFEASGATIVPVEVDAEGINVEQVMSIAMKRPIKAIYVTPHHQYPTTVSLSLPRRLRIIELCNTFGITLIEDDYDHEFHYQQRPLLPLSSYKELDSFLYVGSLSKVVAPALRVGYLAGSQEMIKKIGQLRSIIDVQGDVIMELAVLELITSGEIKRHLRKATNHYRMKRDMLHQILTKYLEGKAGFVKPDGGLSYWVSFNEDVDLFGLFESLMHKGIQVITPDKFSYGQPINGLRLGFGSLNEEQLEIGVKAIATELREK